MPAKIFVGEGLTKMAIKITINKILKTGKVKIENFVIEPIVLVTTSGEHIYVTESTHKLLKRSLNPNKISGVILRVYKNNNQFQIEVFKNGSVEYSPSQTTLTPEEVVLLTNKIATL